MFKTKATHIADKLLPAFNTSTGIPYSEINPKTGVKQSLELIVLLNNIIFIFTQDGHNRFWASNGCSILSEFGALHLEFSYLSDITGNPVYRQKVQVIRNFLEKCDKPFGLYNNYLNPHTGEWGDTGST